MYYKNIRGQERLTNLSITVRELQLSMVLFLPEPKGSHHHLCIEKGMSGGILNRSKSGTNKLYMTHTVMAFCLKDNGTSQYITY